MVDAYFVSIQDAGRSAFILGPFFNEDECREYAYSEIEEKGDLQKHHEMKTDAYKIDPKSHFYSWGMAKIPSWEWYPFPVRGILNKVNPEKWDKVIGKREDGMVELVNPYGGS